MSPHTPNDELLQRYEQAKAACPDGLPSEPSVALRERIMQAAREQANAINSVANSLDSTGSNGLKGLENSGEHQITTTEAANDSFWNIKAVASLAVMGLSALLWWQFEHGTPEEKQATQSAQPSTAVGVAVAPAVPEPVATAPATTMASAEPAATPAVTPAVTPAPATRPAPAGDAVARKEAQTSKPSEAKIASAENAEPSAAALPTPAPVPAPLPEAARSREKEAARSIATAPAPAPAPAPAAATAAPQLSQADKALADVTPPSAAAGAAPAASPQRSLEMAPAPSMAAAPPPAPAAAPTARAAAPRSTAPAPLATITSPDKLFAAIEAKDATALRQALTQGASPNARSPEGNNALTQAVIQRWSEGVRILLATGADRNVKNNKGRTAGDVALELGYQDIVELLARPK